MKKTEVSILDNKRQVFTNRCCGRCDGVDDKCYADITCEPHNVEGCETCYGKSGWQLSEEVPIIPDEIFKGITWKIGDDAKGGQSCGIMSSKVTLTHRDLEFSITCNPSRSQLKNKEYALEAFRKYLADITVTNNPH